MGDSTSIQSLPNAVVNNKEQVQQLGTNNVKLEVKEHISNQQTPQHSSHSQGSANIPLAPPKEIIKITFRKMILMKHY
jgi:hypothetical protein